MVGGWGDNEEKGMGGGWRDGRHVGQWRAASFPPADTRVAGRHGLSRLKQGMLGVRHAGTRHRTREERSSRKRGGHD